MILCWAFRNSDIVGAFVGIYPVCNIASWPLKNSKQSTLNDYQMTEAEILVNLTKINPPENLQQRIREAHQEDPQRTVSGGDGPGHTLAGTV